MTNMIKLMIGMLLLVSTATAQLSETAEKFEKHQPVLFKKTIQEPAEKKYEKNNHKMVIVEINAQCDSLLSFLLYLGEASKLVDEEIITNEELTNFYSTQLLKYGRDRDKQTIEQVKKQLDAMDKNDTFDGYMESFLNINCDWKMMAIKFNQLVEGLLKIKKTNNKTDQK